MLFIVLLCAAIHPQTDEQLMLIDGNKTSYLPAFVREGQIYFSLTHFADALSFKHSFNSQGDKIEIQFDNYVLRSSIKNPYLVLVNKQNERTKILQLPTSTYIRNNNLFLPLNYSLPILSTAANRQFELIEHNKLVVRKEQIPKVKGMDTEKSSVGIIGFTLDEKANGTLVRIKCTKQVSTYHSSLNDNVLTIVFRDVNLDESKFSLEKKQGLIKDIKAKNLGKDCELNFTLKDEFTSSEVLNADKGNDILITLHNKVFTNNMNKTTKSERWNFDVIVIDAGHGGKDHGAIGINGAKEKDINLAVALKLGKLIEKGLKDVKVVYTRKDDTFIELYKRGKIANDNNGKLFISIHCNSTAKKNSDASGFEVYLLRPGKTQDAIEIAERENAVIQYESDPKRYQKLTDENFILVSMAHSSYLKYSEKFAELLHDQFSSDFDLQSRGVKQAGFYVLVGTSMPSVLIETGFLSNKRDADYLRSSKGQDEIAEAIFKAIKGYKSYYDKVMEAEL